MKAVGYHAPGTIERSDALIDLEIPAPVPLPRDLLVRVKAVSVNQVDLKIRASVAPPAGQFKILGWDAAGVVEAVGTDVTNFRVGDEVFYAGDVTRQGTNAELHCVDERLAGPKPGSLDWAAAAAMPLTTLTAWELMFERMKISRNGADAGKSILVVNGAGGVGSLLIQLASRLAGLNVVATASRPQSAAFARAMGATEIINHHLPLDDQLAKIGLKTVDYVASLAGSERQLPYYAKILAPFGHLGLIDDPAQFDITRLRNKSVSVSWEGMFTKSLYRTPDMDTQHAILKSASDYLDRGILKSTLTDVFGQANAHNFKAAHQFLESGKSIGKVALAF